MLGKWTLRVQVFVGHVRQVVDVLRGLRFQHIHDVVVRDDTDEPSLGIDYRDSRQIIFRHDPCDLFLIRPGFHGDHFRVHQVFHHRVRIGFDQIPEVYDSNQPSRSIDDVQVIRYLGDVAHLTQEIDCLSDGGIPPEGNVGCGHQAACRLVRIPQQRQDLVGILHLSQCLRSPLRRHIPEQVSGFVRLHFVQNVG